MPESHELSRADCERLLRAGVVGRMTAMTDDGPHIIPVNYSVVDDSIVVRTTAESLLGKHACGVRSAFQIDQLDFDYHRGWSVLARGRCEVVEDPAQLAHIESVSRPTPWASGSRQLVLRLVWSELSGRRLGARWDRRDEPVVHRTR